MPRVWEANRRAALAYIELLPIQGFRAAQPHTAGPARHGRGSANFDGRRFGISSPVPRKTDLEFPDTELVAWKDLSATPEQLAQLGGTSPSMTQVSGVGTYRSTFRLPASWEASDGLILDIGSTNGDATEVWVNGRKADGVDLRTLEVDITDLLVTGKGNRGVNEITVIVASTLTNRLLARGYNGTAGPAQSYGMTGDVRLIPYAVGKVNGR